MALLLVTELLMAAGVAASYSVHAAVAFTRTGEHTPFVMQDRLTQLTSVGAQQLYAAGAGLRKHFIVDPTSEQGATSKIVGE